MSARRAPPIPDSEPLNVVPPRQFVPTGTYLGHELRRTSARPGAYDAFALPSKFGKQAAGLSEDMRAAIVAERDDPLPARMTIHLSTGGSVDALKDLGNRRFWPIHSPATPADTATPTPPIARKDIDLPPKRSARSPRPLTPLPRGISLSAYVPRPGSAPFRLIEALKAEGGHLTYAQISERFDVVPGSVTVIFKPAVVKGALVRHVIDGRTCLALPDYVPPPPAPSRPSSAATQLLARLEAHAEAYTKAFAAFRMYAPEANDDLFTAANQSNSALRVFSAAVRTHFQPAPRAKQ